MNKKLSAMSLLLLPTMFNAKAAELDVGYDSKYVSEGRSQFITGGILWINFNLLESKSI